MLAIIKKRIEIKKCMSKMIKYYTFKKYFNKSFK